MSEEKQKVNENNEEKSKCDTHSEKCNCHDDKCKCHGDDKNSDSHVDEDNCTCGDECKCGCNDEKNISKEDEYLLLAKTIQAEFENYRKRTLVQLAQAKQDGFIVALSAIIPALDSFKKAFELVKDEDSLEGIKLVQKNIMSALKTLGVETISAKGQKFDPNLHNALAVVPTKEYEDGIIIEEAQTGYTLGGKVIKYSQVVVAKNEIENKK
ncbi:MAG: nucleotide exchange factor GrpE [Clostridia bacterium]